MTPLCVDHKAQVRRYKTHAKRLQGSLAVRVFKQVFKDRPGNEEGLGDLDPETSQKIRNIKLTRSEFADAMGLQASSIFVRNMFLLVDRSKDGFVSFDEFMKMFITMANGE